MDVVRELIASAKLLVGMDFDTKDQLQKYLKDHPGSDKSKHTVKNKGDKPQPKEDGAEKTEKTEKTPQTDGKGPKPKSPHAKKKVDKKSIARVQSVMSANELSADSDEMGELAGFKGTLGQRVPDKDVGKWFVRNAAQLKRDFVSNMDPSNYANPDAFAAAKQRVQGMSTNDFAKVLAAVNEDEEE